MKQFYLSLITFLYLGSLEAQYHYLPYLKEGKNPGSLNKDTEFYPGGGLTTGWTTILAGPKPSGTWSTVRTIPFKFNFNGSLVTKYKASNSGVVTFNSASVIKIDSNNVALPTPLIPDSSICVWGLRSDTLDFIVTKTFGTIPNRQHWISYYSFSEQNLKKGWIYISIVLEETTNKIYIVDQRTQCVTFATPATICQDKTDITLGIQIDANNAIMVNGSPNYQSDQPNNSTPLENTYFEFVYGTQPQYDILARNHEIGKFYAIKNFPINMVGVFRNIGTETISKVTYNYNVNDGPVFSSDLSSLNAGVFEELQLTHPIPISINTKGTYTLKSWISQINDNAPTNIANDTIKSAVTVFDTAVERQLLHENWTSSTCPPCKPGNETLHEVLANYSDDQWTEINYHYFFPGVGDPYYTIEAIARGRFYAPINTANGNVYISSIPATVLDGKTIINPNGYTTQQFDEYQQIPAFYEVIPSGTVTGQKINIKVDIKTYAPTSATTRLFVAVCEKQTFDNVKTNLETEFPHVMKKMVSDTNGTLVGVLPEKASKSFNLSWTAPGVYRLPLDAGAANRIDIATEHTIEEFEDLEVVAWIQETDKTILQSNSADLEFVVSNYNPVIKKEISVNPNPSNDFFFINMSAFDNDQELRVLIADATGKLVYAEKTNLKSLFINSSNWNPGMYHIKVVGKNQEANKKIVVIE